MAWRGGSHGVEGLFGKPEGGQTGSLRPTPGVPGYSTEPRRTHAPEHLARGWKVKDPSPDGFKSGAEGKHGRKFPKFKIRSQNVKVYFLPCQGHISESEVNAVGLH